MAFFPSPKKREHKMYRASSDPVPAHHHHHHHGRRVASVKSPTSKGPSSVGDADRERLVSVRRKAVLEGIESSEIKDALTRSVDQYESYEKRVGQMSSSGADTKIMQYIYSLTEKEKREDGLAALSKRRENYPDLAPLLWGTPGVVAALLQEVISVYPFLTGGPTLTTTRSNRCCNALALLQCVASHPETRNMFLLASIPLYLYPFLNAKMNTKPFEYLRLTSLGVIGALVKQPHPSSGDTRAAVPDKTVTEFLVTTEAIPLCLNIMEFGNELSKVVATFIIQKILLDQNGLCYICKTPERFFAVSKVLKNMISEQNATARPSKRLIKHAIRCYLRLCDDGRAAGALPSAFPDFLRSDKVRDMFADDSVCLQWLDSLSKKLATPRAPDDRYTRGSLRPGP